MKKILLTTLIGTALVGSAMAQGTVLFDNYVDPTFIALVYGPEPGDATISKSGQSAADVPTGSTVYGGAGLQGSRYAAQLWGGPLGTAEGSLNLITSTTFYDASSGAPAGVFTGVNGVVAGVLPGQQATFQVRVFDTQSGATFALATVTGKSALFQSSGPLGGSDATGTLFFPPETTGWQSFNIHSTVPEPSTFALAGLGAAALLIFRRRK